MNINFFPNLNAELKRIGKGYKDLADFLEMGTATISLRANGKRDWGLTECKKIKNHFFPTCALEYLFLTKEEIEQQKEEE